MYLVLKRSQLKVLKRSLHRTLVGGGTLLVLHLVGPEAQQISALLYSVKVEERVKNRAHCGPYWMFPATTGGFATPALLSKSLARAEWLVICGRDTFGMN